MSSIVAQWKRAGPITQRSEDQNLALLNIVFKYFNSRFVCTLNQCSYPSKAYESRVIFFSYYIGPKFFLCILFEEQRTLHIINGPFLKATR